jgi:hypothetical protein
MAASEVAVAARVVRPMRSTSMGTTRSPPPTPKSALRNPEASPIPARTRNERLADGTALS